MPPKRKSQQTTCSVESVGRIFEQVHKSSAHIHKCKAELLKYAEENQSTVFGAVCRAVLLVLKESPRLAADFLKRHYSFLVELGKGFRERFKSDEITIVILKTLLPYHNANDKSVRLSVVSLYGLLLKTVDKDNVSEERQNLYQEIADMLKFRIHDKHPPVREHAIAAIACFQLGKKSCDVTQQLIALLCTDTSADVRRQILDCISARKEFLEGYFHGMVRCVRDTVARVRAAAWDALSRFPWKYITFYASAKKVNLLKLIKQGLSDTNKSAAIACRAALTNCWLHRDYANDCEAMLEPVLGSSYDGASLEACDLICLELLHYCKRHKSISAYVVNFECVSAASLLMWKANAKLSADAEGDDETPVLLPLPQFSVLLNDTVFAYARPDVEVKSVKFKNVDEADIMLRCLLSVFDIYQENGYLTHADNTTRSSLLRSIGFLLKVVPDEDPALFVDVAVRSLKSLTERIPEEATTAVTSSLSSLFRRLQLPQQFALGYDDIEAFGQKSRERQRLLNRLRMKARAGEVPEEEYNNLKEEMDRDEKFLLRMQYIVSAFLSNSQRGDSIPTFCSHVIQLGRQQDDEAVKMASTTSLGLQCLINPDTVHTFMPLIVNDAKEMAVSSEKCVSVVALGVAFDLVMEYGLRFFDSPARGSGPSDGYERAGGDDASKLEQGAGAYPIVSAPVDEGMEARLLHERTLAGEDEHRVGGNNLLNTLRSFLRARCAIKNPMAVVGFCKLLSCNRVPQGQVHEVIAEILLHHAVYRCEEKCGGCSAYMTDYLNKFFQSFASSHPSRQSSFCQGGLIAFAALARQKNSTAPWLIDFVTRLCDAYLLVQIRDIDPETARQATRLTGDSSVGSEDNTLARNTSSRATTTRNSIQSGRLSRELSRFSLHETIASQLLMEIAQTDCAWVREICISTLEKRMYFYAKDLPQWLLFCSSRALDVVKSSEGDSPLAARLQAWKDSAFTRFQAQSSMDGNEEQLAKWNEAIDSRELPISKLLSCPFFDFVSKSYPSHLEEIAPNKETAPVAKAEKREREPESAFDIESIVGRRRRKPK
ncbi:hypothetical protein TRVL_01547 [Trypanosoma vivax]|nr:hypothetical protein TRVL_01547 [Trypanosoma vivax]